MSKSDSLPEVITRDAILSVLRDSDHPLELAAIRHALAERHGARRARATVNASLERMRLQSLVVYLDDLDRPRRWLAVPTDLPAPGVKS